MTHYSVAVSFEFLNKPPETIRMELDATKPETASHRAVKAARKQLPGRHPCSIVVVLEIIRDVEAAIPLEHLCSVRVG